MSAPRLISPLLDNFVMGEPIYDQGGIRILPAMEQGKENKYIVKIISTPATQTQVDALLISGAYKDADEVNGYFAELSDAVIREARVLTQLSSAGGFDGYENMQVVPMDDGNGYDVYLLAPYRPTWARVSQQKTITQLDGYNLALDICAALSVARRNGYIYTNLKPENISVTASGSYHICDLGLLSLDYLQYSSLPSAYFSAYTAPEITDAYSSPSNTMDVYALGMILYEIFNGGLPLTDANPGSAELAAPAYAEEEFAQIILKAIHPEPAERWQDPTEMGQAIVSVMQRNGVSDAPIIPVVEITEETPEEENEEPAASAECAADPSVTAEDPMPAENAEEPAEENTEEIAEEEPADIVEAPVSEDTETAFSADEEADVEETADTEEAAEENSIPCDTDTAVCETEELIVHDESDQDILLKADALLAEIDDASTEGQNMNEHNDTDIAEAAENTSDIGENEENDMPSLEEDEAEEIQNAPKKTGKRKVILACSIVLFVLLIIGGLFCYRHVYLQEIKTLSVSGAADHASVCVIADIASDKLSVVFTDNNGDTVEVPLVDYKAELTGLAANTNYTVSVKVEGFHKLFGQTEYTYCTPEVTEIQNFTVLNGIEEGAAEVSFKVAGPNAGSWTVTFTSQDEDPHTFTAVDGRVSATGLTLNKTYTVTLSCSADLYIDKRIEQTFTPGAVIAPLNPYVSSCVDGKLTVRWSLPEDSDALSWIVHCYNENGFGETVTVSEAAATFDVPDSSKAYCVEISAVGQAAKEIVQITENSITLSDFTIDTSTPGRITLKWTASGDIPEGGYVVTYTVDGIHIAETVKTNTNSITILSAVPNAVHAFTFAGANGESILHDPVAVTATGENPFSAFGIKAENMRINLCPRPNKTNWVYRDVSSTSYTTTFSVGQKAGVAARITSRYYTSKEVVAIVYVFRNAENAIAHVCSTEQSWGSLWDSGYGAFNVPSLPDTPGSYKLDMYIDGGLVHQTNITMK